MGLRSDVMRQRTLAGGGWLWRLWWFLWARPVKPTIRARIRVYPRPDVEAPAPLPEQDPSLPLYQVW